MADPRFRLTQYAFAAYIRDPEHNPAPPEVKSERMEKYRELFFNNISNCIASGFPIMKQVLDESHWLGLVQDFFARHRSTTPYFSELPEEFLAFMREERAHPKDPPFLFELAHYEWVELALYLADGEAPAQTRELLENPLACGIKLSDVAWPLAYRFPVHLVTRDCQPSEPPDEPTYLAVYRNREDDVRFLEVNPVTFRLLEILQEAGPQQAGLCLGQIASELGVADPGTVLVHGEEILRELARRGVIGEAVDL